MNVLIVVPRYAGPGKFYNWPIGLASIYAFLKRNGFLVSCLNLCHETVDDTGTSLKNAFKRQTIDVVCTGGMAMHSKKIEDIFTNAKLIRPEVITVAGGPIVTADPEMALRHLPIDFGVIGEGEYAMVELLEALRNGSSPDSVKGLAFIRNKGEFVFTGARKEISDLDSLPMPEYEDFGFKQWMTTIKYAKQMTILENIRDVRYAEMIGSRSCPFSCTFCYHPLGKVYRKRSIEHIFKEIDFLVNTYGVNVIAFGDELFSANNEQMLQFAERIRPYNLKYLVQLRVNNIQQEVLEKLVESGAMYATFGIESMSDRVLKSMKKQTTRSEIINALALARKARLYCSGNIILGDPADTLETITESISWVQENPSYNISLGFVVAVPDAPIYRYALEQGIIKDKWAHVRNNLPLVNLTKISNWKYYNLLLKVQYWNFMHSNNTAGVLVSSKKLEEQFEGKHFYMLEMRCPFCGCEQKLKTFMGYSTPNVLIVCVKCFASFKISQNNAFYDDYSLFSTARYLFFKMANVILLRFSFGRTYLGVLRDLAKRCSRGMSW